MITFLRNYYYLIPLLIFAAAFLFVTWLRLNPTHAKTVSHLLKLDIRRYANLHDWNYLIFTVIYLSKRIVFSPVNDEENLLTLAPQAVLTLLFFCWEIYLGLCCLARYLSEEEKPDGIKASSWHCRRRLILYAFLASMVTYAGPYTGICIWPEHGGPDQIFAYMQQGALGMWCMFAYLLPIGMTLFFSRYAGCKNARVSTVIRGVIYILIGSMPFAIVLSTLCDIRHGNIF
ncbi:MAG: hypothetical protein PHW04_07310 [Candidatus Wallbacteria bacterium]|nr:hypothetical protein [Candidatus Wallbacteria bacterium]